MWQPLERHPQILQGVFCYCLDSPLIYNVHHRPLHYGEGVNRTLHAHVTQHPGHRLPRLLCTHSFCSTTDNQKGQELLKVKCSHYSNQCCLPCLLATGCGVMSMESMLFSPADRMMSLLCVCERGTDREFIFYIYSSDKDRVWCWRLVASKKNRVGLN